MGKSSDERLVICRLVTRHFQIKAITKMGNSSLGLQRRVRGRFKVPDPSGTLDLGRVFQNECDRSVTFFSELIDE
jgi:hypothetical protein